MFKRFSVYGILSSKLSDCDVELSPYYHERRLLKKGLVLNKISTFFVFLSKIPLLYCPLIVYFTCPFITKSSFFPYNCLV